MSEVVTSLLNVFQSTAELDRSTSSIGESYPQILGVFGQSNAEDLPEQICLLLRRIN